MQNGKILDIYVKENNVTVVWHLPQEEKTQEKVIPQTQPRVTKKYSLIKDIVTATVKQICSLPPTTTKFIFTNKARKAMKNNHIPDYKVKETILRKDRQEGDKFFKKYNGYEVGAIAVYSRETNTYKVLTAWK
jgi:hypothetical protein